MKFFHKLFLVSILLGLAPMGYLAMRTMDLIEKRITEETIARHQEHVNSLIKNIDQFFIEKERKVTSFIYNQQIDQLDQEKLKSICDILLSQNPEIEIITILDESMQERVGRQQVTSFNDKVSPKMLFTHLEKLNETFLDRAKNGKAFSKIEYNESQPYVTLALPYPSNQKNLFGIVAIRLSLAEVEGMLETSDLNKNLSSSVLLNEESQVVLSNFENNKLSENIWPKSVDSLKAMEGKASLFESTNSSDRDLVGLFKNIPDTPWSCYHFEKTSYAFASLNFLKSSITYLWVAILLGVLCGAFLLSRRLVGPVHVLSKAALAYGQGDLDHQFKLSGKDELVTLGHQFKDMATKLKVFMEAEKENIRREEEIKVAQAVQQTLVTSSFPQIQHYDIAGFYKSASEAGGDWYGYVELPSENSLLLILGDVTGHGVGSALVTAASNTFFKTLELWFDSEDVSTDPAQILEDINQVIYRSTQGTMAMTMFIMKLNLETGDIIFSNAGHNSPYLFRKNVEEKEGSKKSKKLSALILKGSPLGYKPDSTYKTKNATLNRGDYLMIFSDGIIECCNKEGVEYGKKKFKNLLENYQGESSDDFLKLLVDDAYQYYNKDIQEDDITLLMLRSGEDA